MQATLIYNPNARATTTSPSEELQEALIKAGYQPVCRITASEQELDEVLAGIEGLVIAAGGDGSLRAVVTRLIGKKNVCLSVLCSFNWTERVKFDFIVITHDRFID